MRQFILITAILIASLLQGNAQNPSTNSQQLLQGKYELFLKNIHTDHGYTISLNNNLPGIYHIRATFEITDSQGNKEQISVNKRQVGKELNLCHTKDFIQELSIKSFNIDYVQFGEAYSLAWTQQSGILAFSKQGKEFSYANPFMLNTSSFKWLHQEKQNLPAELKGKSTDLIANY